MSKFTGRIWLVGGGFSALVILLIGWFFVIGPQRAETDDVQAQAESAQLQNTGNEARLQTLQRQKSQLPTFQAQLAAARRALPQSDGVAPFLRTLQALGGATQTSVTALSVGAPEAFKPVAGTTPSTSPSSTPPSSTPTAGAGAGASVYTLPITAQVTGSPVSLEKFLAQLQNVQPRAVLITSATTAAGTESGGGSTTLSLTMQAFVAPAATTPSGSPGTAAP